jgi:chaperonin GroEL
MVAPGLLLQPHTRRAFLRGVNTVVDAVAPTLGPSGRLVAMATEQRNAAPELLDSAAVIARRLIELPDRDENVGAMYVRHMLWRLYERNGDGTATAAVIFRAIVQESARYLMAGGNAALLRSALLAQWERLDALLPTLTLDVSRVPLASLVEGLGGDANLGVLLSEAFHHIGPCGALEVRKNNTAEDWLEFINGAYWKSEPFDTEKLAAGERELHNAHILVSDLAIDALPEAVTLVKTSFEAGVKSLLITCSSMSAEVRAFFANVGKPGKFEVAVVKLPGLQLQDQMAAMDDLALLTGATPVYRAAGESAATVRPEAFGQAGRVWVMRHYFGLEAGGGNAQRLTAQVAGLQTNMDDDLPDTLTSRIGRLNGESAVLVVGGTSADDIERRVKLAEQVARGLRRALRGGVIAGGGAALWQLAQTLRNEPAENDDVRAAARILATALETPLRIIAHNAGHDPALACAALAAGEHGRGYDARTAQAVDCAATGLVQPLALVRDMLNAAIGSAAQAITIDVVVKHRKPEVATEP